ncbi:hypothetical protein ACFL7E_02620 [Thermodesulfobacteriota bacterium]
MKRIILTAMVMVSFLTGLAYSEESYLCTRDQATGFAYNKVLKKWVSTTFETDAKYIVTKSKTEKSTWEVKKLGNDYVLSNCEVNFNQAGILFCDGVSEFTMNKINLRYLLTFGIGYYYTGEGMKYGDEKSPMPYMEIGKCRRIER